MSQNICGFTEMLREAEMRFRVKDVQKTTATFEKMAVSHGGYVAKSMYDIEESETIIKKLSTDSAQEIKQLRQSNHMEVFVLNTKLDSFLDRVKPWVDHLEYRHLTATEMVELPKHSDGQGNFAATELPFAQDKWQSINKKFSRVIMDFYQTPVTQKWTIPNPDSFEVARGGFWDDFGSSFKAGWRGVTMAFNYFISFWPLWVIVLLVFFWVKRRKGGFKNLFKKA